MAEFGSVSPAPGEVPSAPGGRPRRRVRPVRSPVRRRVALSSVAALLAAALLAGITACGGPDLPVYWEAPEFSLVDQEGDTLRASELRGAPWVASFIFTNCTGVCPLISARMALLRDRLAEEERLGEEVRLVSFSVDPARDTPEALRRYAEGFGGSPPDEWAFLTGTPPGEVRALIQEGFRLSVGQPPTDSATRATGDSAADHESAHGEDVDYQVLHSPRLLLVDARGRVRGTYDSREGDVVDRVLADLDRLR